LLEIITCASFMIFLQIWKCSQAEGSMSILAKIVS
jgi:hypothetical protein